LGLANIDEASVHPKLLRIKNQWPVKGKPIMSESPGSNPNQSNQVCANL